jgi:2',3'-cyclic-nucleotide 2'-phosphodiesterase (5'-nucleotidase family)
VTGDATSQTGDPGRAPSAFDRQGRIGGFPALVTMIAKRRAALGADTVALVDGGDTFSDDLLGNLTKGEAVISCMNDMGYDFMALGNHDFDYGFDRTKELHDIAAFPMRGANITMKDGGAPVFGDPTLVVERGGMRIGLLALGYHNTDQTGNPNNFANLDFTSGIDAAARLVPELRTRADVVVVVSHQGSKVDREMLRQVEGIDVVVGAHSHDLISPPEVINGAHLVQALSDSAYLGEVTLTLNGDGALSVTGTAHALWEDEVEQDPAMTTRIDAWRAPHLAELGEQIGTAAQPLTRQYKTESPIDKLACRVMRDATGAQIGFMPGVGYGITIPAGPVTREALTTLLPHPSKFATLTLTGAQLRSILEQSAKNQAPDDPLDVVGGILQTDGVVWSADLRKPAGKRVTEIHVDGAPVTDDGTYTAVLNAGLLRGLHRLTTFAEGHDISRRDELVQDLLIDAMGRGDPIAPPPLGDFVLTRG